MTATLDDVTKKIKKEPSAEEQLVADVRNGTRPRTVLTEATGQVQLEVPPNALPF